MVWSVEAIRHGDGDRAKRYFRFPPEAVGAKPGDQFFIKPWTLETLVNEALVHPSADVHSRRILDTTGWGAFAQTYNLVDEIENAESLQDIPTGGLRDAMPRIGWRQFGWQVGYSSAHRFFRGWWLYNFSEASEFFSDIHGLSIERFCYVGFAVAAHMIESPALRIDASLGSVGITDLERDAFFRVVALPCVEARKRAIEERTGNRQIAYKPSILRRYPIITTQNGKTEEAFCPIPDLLHLRITDGLFYDLVDNDNLKRLVGRRFEEYAFEVTNHYLGESYTLLKESAFGTKKRPQGIPDLRIIDSQGHLSVVVECKARRIPFKVLSSPRPYLENEDVYEDIVKGVIQIWRYLAKVRQGIADKPLGTSENIVGIILTLEPWLEMHSETIKYIKDRASEQCRKYPEVEHMDQVEIGFVSIDDWEHSIQRIDARGFVESLNEHASPKKYGYLLRTTIDEFAVGRESVLAPYDYHGGISRLVSWWDAIRKRQIPTLRRAD